MGEVAFDGPWRSAIVVCRSEKSKWNSEVEKRDALNQRLAEFNSCSSVWTVRRRDILNEQGHIEGRLVTVPVTKPYVTLHVCRLGAYAYPETVHDLRAR